MLTFDKTRPWLLVAGFLMAASPAWAGALPKPEGLQVAGDAGARFEWQPVDGAALYRVAVFDAPEADGKRPLLAAVWVQGTAWDYARGPVLASAGKLPSTKPMPLPQGRTLRVMVAAARADGSDKSEWSGEDFKAAQAPARALPTPSPAATEAPAEPQLVAAPAAAADAELTLEGGDEFKSSPDPAEIEVDDEPTPTATPSPGPASAASAAALLKAGDADGAEAQYRALLKAKPDDADLWEGLGDALVARRMKAEAYEAYSQALGLDSGRDRLRSWIKTNAPRR